MGLSSTIYNLFLKRTSVFYLTAAVGVFAFERSIDVGCDAVYDAINKGKQWKDIKHKYTEE